MNVSITVRECEDIGHVHYLLAVGFFTPRNTQLSNSERKELFDQARKWFERAYIYGGSDACRRFAESCGRQADELARKLDPALRTGFLKWWSSQMTSWLLKTQE